MKAMDFSCNMLENFPIPIWCLNNSGECNHVNKSWTEFFGMSTDDAYGAGWLDLIHPEDREEFQRVVFKAVKERTPFEIEHRMLCGIKGFRYVISLGNPYYGSEGQCAGHIGGVYDITERKIAEDGLDRYQILSKKARDIIFFVDIDGNIIDVNEAALKAYGYTYEEFCSLSVSDLRAEGVVTRELLDKTDREGVFIETAHYRKDGSSFPIEVSSQGTDIGGKRVLVSIIRDITERKKAEKLLHESQEKYQSLFVHMNDAFSLCKVKYDNNFEPCNLEFVEINDAFKEMFDLSLEDVENTNILDIFPIFGVKFVNKLRELFCKGEKLDNIQIEKYYSPSTKRWVSLSAYSPLPGYLAVIVRDITKSKKAEILVKESQEKYYSLFRNMTSGFFYNRIILDRDGKPLDYIILEVNEACEKLTGKSKAQMVGKRFSEIFGVKSDDSWIDICYRTACKGESFAIEDSYSKVLNMWISASVYSPKEEYFAVVFHDTSARMQASIELKASRAKYQTLLMNMNNGLGYFKVVKDEKDNPVDCIFMEVNTKLEELTGYSQGELMGNTLFGMFPTIKDVGGEFFNLLREIYATGEGSIFTDYYIENTGRWCNVYVYSPEAGYFAIILTDITKERTASQILIKARDEAQAANKAKSEFLANMSHEIRTPINGIVGMVDLTLLTKLTTEQKDNLMTAKSCANSLLNIINDILDFSKMEAGKLIIDNIDFDIKELIEEVVKTNSLLSNEKGLELNYLFSTGIPQYLTGDPNRLKQVINNLVNNAIKFTENGEVTIAVKKCLITEEEAELKFVVSDTGIGIDQEEMDKLFKTFSQVDSSITRKFGGTGLGLVISKQLVEMMGGKMWVESEKGKGSIFSFNAKFKIGEKQKVFQLRKTAKTQKAREVSILIAEDDEVNQKVVTRMLKEKGYLVDVACNGIEAVKLFSEKHYDVILMDIQMPEMDGVEATRKIRDIENLEQHTPIIALTAYALKNDRERFLSKGMDGYIPKPIQMEELFLVIEEAISARQDVFLVNGFRLDKDGNVILLKDEENQIKHDNAVAVSEISKCINELASIINDNDIGKIGYIANTIKNLCNRISADELKSLAFQIELAVRRSNLNDAVRYSSQFIKEFKLYRDIYFDERKDVE